MYHAVIIFAKHFNQIRRQQSVQHKRINIPRLNTVSNFVSSLLACSTFYKALFKSVNLFK